VYTVTVCAVTDDVAEVAGIGEVVAGVPEAQELNNKAMTIVKADIARIAMRIVILYTLIVCF
jgi:hypothetical protein